MKNTAKKISPALFGITLICFFLPFTTLSCQQQQLISLTGVELAIGKNIKQPNFPGGETKEQKIPGEPLAVLSIISTLVGLGTSFIKVKKGAMLTARALPIVPATSGAVGFILLLMLKSKIDNEIIKQGQGLILVSYGLGFWLAFLLLISATVLNIYTLLPEKPEQEQQE